MASGIDHTPKNALHLSISNKEAFIEGCVSLLKAAPLEALIEALPEVDNFLQAYVLARAMPFITEHRPKGADWRAEEAFDDVLGELSSRGSVFSTTGRCIQ